MVETADFLLSFPFVFCFCYARNLSCTTKPKHYYSCIRVFTPHIITCYHFDSCQKRAKDYKTIKKEISEDSDCNISKKQRKGKRKFSDKSKKWK